MQPRTLAVAATMIGLAMAGCVATPNESDNQTQPSPAPDPGAMGPPADLAWTRLADAPVPRAEHCAANVESLFYIIGGYIIANPASLPGAAGGVPTGSPVPRVDIYDAETDTWSQGPDYPTPIDHCLAEAVNGTIYVVYGGANGDASYKITPGDAAWSKIPAPPTGHNAGVSGVIGNKLYVTGGRPAESAAVDVLDPSTDSWTTMNATLPTRRDHTSGAVVGDRFYVVGGDVGGHSSNTEANEAYDPVRDNWTVLAPLPVVRGSLHSVGWRGLVVAMGGQDGRTNVDAYDNVNAYDPATDTWSDLPPLPTGRHGFAAGVWNDAIYVFEGAPQQGVSGYSQVHVLKATS